MKKVGRQPLLLSAVLSLSTAALLPANAFAQIADVGLSTVRAQRFGRSSLPNPNATGGDRFGQALAVGDFNGDGADDLASGAPFSDGAVATPIDQCGAVVVRYGVVGKGLAPGVAPTLLGQFVAPSSSAEAGDRFGFALTACNLNGDAYDDLVVGVPFETVTIGLNIDFVEAGIIEVYYGTSSGLVPPASTTRREVSGQFNFPSPGAHFGEALACGDFNGDGSDDLAVGLPLRDLPSGAVDGGRINVYAGSPSGLAPSAVAIDQDTPGIEGMGETGDRFGSTLVAGSFDLASWDDLAVGVRYETDGNQVPAGLVQVIFGSSSGLSTFDQIFFDSSFGGANETDHQFGLALAAGNFDADIHGDLVIGAPYDDVEGAQSAGQFVEAFGSVSGLGTVDAERFDQDRIFVVGDSSDNELLGSALAVGDFDGDGVDDLAASAPGEGAPGSFDGAVTVVMGERYIGLDPAQNRSRRVSRGVEGFPGDASEHFAYFGRALATGDFDGDGHSDLAIGAPIEREDGLDQVGTVTILYGALFADGFDSAGLGYWSAIGP